MAVLQKSPWYQEILNQGVQQGREEGREEGLLSAICHPARFANALGLELKFGETALELMPTVSQIKNVEKLTALKDAIKTVNSLAEFQNLI